MSRQVPMTQREYEHLAEMAAEESWGDSPGAITIAKWEIDRLHARIAELEAEREDLGILARHLAQSLRNSGKNNGLVKRTVDYLERHNLSGSPLRNSIDRSTDTEDDTADVYKQRLKDKIAVLQGIADTLSGQMALQLEEVLSGEQRYADPDGSVYFPDEVVEQYGQLVSHDLRQPVEPIYSVTEDE